MNKILSVFLLFLPLTVFGSCESGHWVGSVSSDGGVVILEDGEVWQIDDYDKITSSLWLPTDDIVSCDDFLINTDNKEKVGAKQIH